MGSGAVEANVQLVEPWHPRTDRFVASVLFVLVLATYLLTASMTVVQMNDTRAAAIGARQIVVTGSLSLDGDWPVTRDWWSVPGRDGRHYVNRFPGVILWGVPFTWVQEQLMPGPEKVVHPVQLDYRAAGVAGATATALGVLASYVLFRRWLDRRYAVLATLLTAFGTALWSIAADALWPHGLTHLGITLVLLGLARGRVWLLVVGPWLALTARPHVAVGLAVIGVWLLLRRRWGDALCLAIGSATALAAVSLYSWTLFGTLLPAAGYSLTAVDNVVTRPITETLLDIVIGFAARDRGLLVYSPFLVVLAPFTARAWRAAAGWERAAGIGGVVYFLVQIRSSGPVGGADFFGYRTPIEMVSMLAPLLVLAWSQGVAPSRFLRRMFAAFAAASVAIHTYGGIWRPFDPAAVASYGARVSEILEQIERGEYDPSAEPAGGVVPDDEQL